jgi:hypothetical protein
MKRTVLTLFLLLVFFTGAIPAFAQFKRYNNKKYRINFDIPATWVVQRDTTCNCLVCTPRTRPGKADYGPFGGIVFSIEFFNTGLDSALAKTDGYEKNGQTWYASDRGRKHFKTKRLVGHGWYGIYHISMCTIGTVRLGEHTGECENIWISNGKRTFHIDGSGSPLEDSVRTRLLKTVRFD